MSILPLREKTDKEIKTDIIYSFNCKSSSCNKDKIIIFKVNDNISDLYLYHYYNKNNYYFYYTYYY